MEDITMTTCLYDIRMKENNNKPDGKFRKISEYFELGRKMLSVRLPLVVYTDHQEVVDEVRKERQKHGLEEKTTIVWLPFEETLYYQDLAMLTECMETYSLTNWNREKDTPLYVLLNNNKFDFLQRTMDSNPYQSSFFFWMDYGIQHCAKASDEEWRVVWEEWPAFIRNETKRIHHLRIHTVKRPEGKSWKEYYRVIYHHIAGSLFGGHKDPLNRYASLFYNQWHKMLKEEKWWQLDEAVMSIIVEENPDLFRLWYGDYDALITNFIQSKRSWSLVFQTIHRYLDAKQYHESEKVLRTLDDVMKNSRDDPYFQTYLTRRVANDYYRWNRSLSAVMTTLLQENNFVRDNRQYIQNHLHNLRHYNEKCVMKLMAQWVFYDTRNTDALCQWNQFHNHDEVWIPLGNGCLSALSMQANNQEMLSLPLDYLDTLPHQMLKLFRRQFVNFYHVETIRSDYTNPYGIWFEHFVTKPHAENQETFKRHVDQLYDLLENPSKKTVFLHTTELFLMRPFTEEENMTYDQELIALCDYLERNYPSLDFVMVCLYTNRAFTAPNEIHKRMIVFLADTPYAYKESIMKDKSSPFLYSYREGIYEWYRMLSA